MVGVLVIGIIATAILAVPFLVIFTEVRAKGVYLAPRRQEADALIAKAERWRAESRARAATTDQRALSQSQPQAWQLSGQP